MHSKIGPITTTEREIVWMIANLENPDPNSVLTLNRAHRGFEFMHRVKDVTHGEVPCTNSLNHA